MLRLNKHLGRNFSLLHLRRRQERQIRVFCLEVKEKREEDGRPSLSLIGLFLREEREREGERSGGEEREGKGNSAGRSMALWPLIAIPEPNLATQ